MMATKSTINTEKVNMFIVEWLRDYATNSKMNGFVIGISGGIDSAVTSTLCAQTGFPVLCVEMPIHQDKNHVLRANKHIEWLQDKFSNITRSEIDLTATFETFRDAIDERQENANVDLALANTRARLRMTTLYYYAGLKSMLVAGTGNKIEDFGVGFFTKYGDGGVDLSPIADLMKSDVFSLGHYLQIDGSILTAAPTDGLFGDDRSDETQIGASYDELEWAMQMDAKAHKIEDFNGRESEVFRIYKSRNAANQHKMNPIPVCLIPEMYK